MKLKKLLIHDVQQDRRVIFFADLHYNHENVIMFDSRPFKNVKEMNESIIEELKTLRPGDTVFDLGDTFWSCEPSEVLKVLNCIPKGVVMHKILGNHDKAGLYTREDIKSKYETISESLDIKVQYGTFKNCMLSLDHFPKVSWNHKPRGAFMVHGHTHGNIDEFNSKSSDLRIDVSYGGQFARSKGTFLIEFSEIYDHFVNKIGSDDFKRWTNENCNEL